MPCAVVSLALVFVACNRDLEHKDIYADDTPRRSMYSLDKFSAKVLSGLEGASEEEVRRLFSGPPSKIRTYRPWFQKQLNGDEFKVDRILVYYYGREIRLSEKPGHTRVVPMEVLSVTLFLFEGSVRDYFVYHVFRETANSEYRRGPFASEPFSLNHSYPGASADGKLYLEQRHGLQ